MENRKIIENAVAKEISLSIKEGKWLEVVYDSFKEGRATSFWCFVNDIEPVERKLFVSAFNETKGVDTIDLLLRFNRIISAKVIRFSIGEYNAALVSKINSNLKDFEWLKFENFSNNILRYLERCSEADSDPYVKDYCMIKGLDAEILTKNGELLLSDEQIHSLVRYVIKYDLKEWENRRTELAISRLSIDKDDKKYIVAYQNVFFSPKDKKMKIKDKIRVNPSFLVDGCKHSLHYYTELNALEFKEAINADFLDATNSLREGLRAYEKINTRPEFFCLQREMQINLPLFVFESRGALGE